MSGLNEIWQSEHSEPSEQAVDSSPETKREALRNTPPNCPEWLWEYIREFYGYCIPRQKICPEHNAPFQYIAGAFFDEQGEAWTEEERALYQIFWDVIVWACRGGLKTLGAGVLSALECKFKPGCGIRGIGGSFDQSEKMYNYFTRAVDRRDLIGEALKKLTKFINKSRMMILPQSLQAVLGEHVPKVRCDEYDEFDPKVVEGIQQVTSSEHGIKSSFEMLSTVHNINGQMENLLKTAEVKGIPVLKWCLWEVIEKCPCPKPIGEGMCKGKCEEVITFDENQISHSFWSVCQGRAKKVTEYRFPARLIDDIHKIFKRSTFENFEVQALCKRPKTGAGSFYKAYNDHYPGGLHVCDDFYNPEWELHHLYDGGYWRPRLLIGQKNPETGQLFIIDEWCPTELSDNDFRMGVWEFCYDKGYKEPEKRLCDPACKSLRKEFNNRFTVRAYRCEECHTEHLSRQLLDVYLCEKCKKELYPVDHDIEGVNTLMANNDHDVGAAAVRKFLRYNERIEGAMINFCQRVKETRKEFRELHYEKPKGSEPPKWHVKRKDEGPDLVRYWVVHHSDPKEFGVRVL